MPDMRLKIGGIVCILALAFFIAACAGQSVDFRARGQMEVGAGVGGR